MSPSSAQVVDTKAKRAILSGAIPGAGAMSRARLAAGLAMFSAGWGGNQFTPLLTMYRSVSGWSAFTVDALLAAYILGLAPGLLIGGPASDHWGRRRLVIGGTALSLVGSGVMATTSLAAVAAGRLLTGAGLGIAMAAGTSWVAELTAAGGGTARRGTRVASLWLTAGLGLGAVVAGVLAQTAPRPRTLAYLVHVVIAAVALLAVVAWAPDVRRDDSGRRLRDRLRIPAAGHVRFVRLVLPLAPWSIGALAVAYAIVPQAVHLGHGALIYATALTGVTLAAGFVVQPLAHRLDEGTPGRAISVAMGFATVGVAVAAVAARTGLPAVGVVAAVVLGCAYGVAVVSGLLEVQRIARPDEVAGLTGLFYAIAYVGFLFPAIVAAIADLVPTWTELVVLAAIVLACAASVTRARRSPALHGV